MLSQRLPQSAEVYAATQRAEIAAAVAAVRRQWRRMPTRGSWDAEWARIAPTVQAIVETAQRRVAAGAFAYVPAVLDETGQRWALDAVAEPVADALVGVAGDGRPIGSLAYGAVVRAGQVYDAGLSATAALQAGSDWLTSAIGTSLSDTGRAAESVASGVRPVSGYVRMLNPPSCSRCVILAGRWYRRNTGFQRHPKCDCRHIPASESVAGDLTVDGHEYVGSLSDAQQDKLLGRAGAEAWRAGGDLNQIVNARRGMRTAQIGGRSVLITTEGTTRRALAYDRLAVRGTTQVDAGFATRITRNGPESRAVKQTVARRPRLMPETISQVATDKADYLRLLRANGYIR